MDYLFAPDRLDTPAFTVRSYEPGDGPLLSEAAVSSYEHLRTFMPWARPTYPVEEAERRCREWCGRYLQATDFVLGIFSPAGDRLLGGTGFHLRDQPLRRGSADIGMWIRADSAGRGLGTQVLLALLTWGFSAWPWVRLTWHCDTRNLASARTAYKAGMLLEGCLRQDEVAADASERRDTYVFAALRGEWTAPGSAPPTAA